jgi:hypothetical protein
MIIRYKLVREYRKYDTIGTIRLKNKLGEVSTLERPWLDNQVGISCIPEGIYEVHRDLHGRHTWFKVLDVEDRTFIEIHEGYKVSHSAGCILLDLIELQDLLLDTQGLPFVLEITH